MGFIVSGSTVVSYADALDIRDKDQRIFQCNEFNFTDAPDAPASLNEYLEDLATKSTARINQKIRSSAQWRAYLNSQGQDYSSQNIPAFDASKILARKSDFTDMCAYYVIKEFLLPKVSCFETDGSDINKLRYYEKKFNDILSELLDMFDWYDWDNDATITDSERNIRPQSRRRSRGRRIITNVR